MNLVGILITVLVAVLVYWLLSFISPIVGIIGAILVLLGGLPTGGFGLGGRYGGRRAL